MKVLRENCKFFTEEIQDLLPTTSAEDSYALEKAVVQHFDCSEEYPLCLYDFTLKQMMIDYQAFSMNIEEFKIEDYFCQ